MCHAITTSNVSTRRLENHSHYMSQRWAAICTRIPSTSRQSVCFGELPVQRRHLPLQLLHNDRRVWQLKHRTRMWSVLPMLLPPRTPSLREQHALTTIGDNEWGNPRATSGGPADESPNTSRRTRHDHRGAAEKSPPCLSSARVQWIVEPCRGAPSISLSLSLSPRPWPSSTRGRPPLRGGVGKYCQAEGRTRRREREQNE